MLRVGVVGCGAIGRALLRAADDGRMRVPIAGVASRDGDRARAFLATLASPPPLLDRQTLIAAADVVVEAAGAHVVADLARATFAAGKDLVVLSVGALLELPDVIAGARACGRRLIVPSGAIAGLDGIKAACQGRVTSVSITTRKAPQGLAGAPYLAERHITLADAGGEQEIFFGTAREACRAFPANVNVAAAVSLAGIGPDATRVRIVSVPGLERNCHDLEVEGEFGRLAVHIESVPSENPRTGRLTALSIMRALEDIADPLRIGT